MAITGDFVNGLHLMVGLSTDSKPTTTSENTFFLEENTGDVYYFSGGSWSKAGDEAIVFIGELLGKDPEYAQYVTPERYGAAGDGVTDDTEAIQACINAAASSGNEVYLPHAAYLVTDTITVAAPINIRGNNSFINGTLNAKPVIKFDTTSGEIRNRRFSKIGVRNYGTGDAVEISGTNAYISCLISECSFYAASGWGIKVGENFAHNKVQLCTFSGNGAKLECGDGNILEKNMFFGSGTGIYLNTPSYGELNNGIINNTIVNAGYAILIDSGDQTWICNNQIEYGGSSDSTNNPSAMIYLRGSTRAVKHCVIQNNNLGGGTHLNYGLYINCGDENVITGNRFVAVNTSDVHVQNGGSTGSTRNYFEDDNFSVTQTSNPRTDTYQKVKVTAAAEKCIIGCWHKLTPTNSQNQLYFKKTKEGKLIFAPYHFALSEVPSVLFTLPTGYRPPQACFVNAGWSGSGNEVMLKINWNGEVSFVSTQTTKNFDINIPDIVIPV